MRAIRRIYLAVLRWALNHNLKVDRRLAAASVMAFGAMQFVGGEFMPALEEGNLWVRATMPVDISFDAGRAIDGRNPADVPGVAGSHRPSCLSLGDPTTEPIRPVFSMPNFWPTSSRIRNGVPGLDKDQLVEEIEARLKTIPGVIFNFSQVIQDNVEEAMSGVKGENSIKLFGTDLKTMESKAVEIESVMKARAAASKIWGFSAWWDNRIS